MWISAKDPGRINSTRNQSDISSKKRRCAIVMNLTIITKVLNFFQTTEVLPIFFLLNVLGSGYHLVCGDTP